MIDFVNETDFVINSDLFYKIFNSMKEDFVFEHEATCCVKFSGDEVIKALNKQYRGCDLTTDVLTFNCSIKNIPFKGDIIININQAERQRQKVALEKEVATLFIHGLLHLAGMDHLSKKEQERMNLYELKYSELIK